MKSKLPSFDTLLASFSPRHDLHSVCEDFLTMSLCAFSQNLATGKSYNEDEYLEIVAKYPKEDVALLAQSLAALVAEMDTRTQNDCGNDVLGEFYEMHLSKRGRSQHFTPWAVCSLISQVLEPQQETDVPIRVLDPACGSGRMLLAGAMKFGPMEEYYGIDIDLTCVKMTTLNLFLNGIFRAEILCADTLKPEDFRVSYVTSLLPFGVYKIDKLEESRLWKMLQAGEVHPALHLGDDMEFASSDNPRISTIQLHLF